VLASDVTQCQFSYRAGTAQRGGLLSRAKHTAIRAGAANQLTFELRGANVVFFANGVEIVKIPYENRAANVARGGGQGGVGLAAFGIGTFSFDRVEIARAN
ncbi:MAG: hypothetical protein H5U18_10080, partial [Rhodobacteraceae bacterium]|nr:hypothetical protein [Paracoccaceae bacterium]